MERYKLRRIRESDVESYNRWSNDYEVVQYTYPVIKEHSMEDTKAFIDMVTSSKSGLTYIIEDSECDKAIGITSFIGIDKVNGNAEFIIDIGEKDYWGKGVGKRATLQMLKIAFEEMDLHRVSLRVFSFNERAIHLYGKLGFTEEGRARQALYRYNQWHDIVHMGILKDEYLSMYGD